jgi:hypothetical protein
MTGFAVKLSLRDRGAALIALALLFSTAACGINTPPSTSVEHHSKVQKKRPEVRSLPAPGTVAVEFSDDRLTVVSNDAPRIMVIEQVAQTVGFELVKGKLAPQKLTLRIEKSPLTQALPMLLPDLHFTSEFIFDVHRKRHRLARLHCGRRPSPDLAVNTAATISEKKTELAPSSSVVKHQWERPPINDNAAEVLPQKVQEMVAGQIELLDQIQSPSSQIRAKAIPKIPNTGQGLHVILDTLALDPDPEVRAAAAQRLASTRSFEAITGLLDAIYDPVPEVALEAIDALTAIKDRSVILSMKSALDHRLEPTVQQALQRGIQSLEFSARMASDEIEIDREASLENSDQVIPQN